MAKFQTHRRAQRNFISPSTSRSALELLAGCPRAIQAVVHNFPIELLVDLIGAGLVTVKAERKRIVGGREIEVASVRLTDAGRLALGQTIENPNVRERPGRSAPARGPKGHEYSEE
jgi:hypothetical protein